MRQRGKRAKVETGAKASVARETPKGKGSEIKHRFAEPSAEYAAISEILGVMSESPGDVRPVLDAVAEQAAHLCEAPFAGVLLADGDVLRSGARFSLDGTKRNPAPLPLKRSSIAGRAVLDRVTIHHDDVVPLLETEYPDAVNARVLGHRAVLAVPLIREGKAYGAIFLFRREPRPFSSDRIRLVETFARQAAIAIDNARLFKETKEALEQQTATSEVLKVIGRSTFDLQPVFATLVENAVSLCAAKRGVILRFDGELLRLAATHNVSPELKEFFERNPIAPGRGSNTGRAVLERSTIHNHDVQSDPEYRYGGAKVDPYRTVLAVPMLKGNEVLGVIAIYRHEVQPFTDKQIALMETFADQAVIAIENVRLFNETKEALERQTATSEILRVISQSPRDVQPAFDTIAEAALKLCRAGSAYACTFDGELIHLVAFANVRPEGADQLRQAFPGPPSRETGLARAVLTRGVVVIPDVLEDPDFAVRAAARSSDFRSVLAVPLLRGALPIGAIGVARPEPGLFPDKQIALLQTFADQAVIAIENARLFKELEARTAELTRSVGELKALGEVGQAVSSTLDLETVLSTIVSHATQLAGVDGGSIYEYDGEREEFHVRATYRLPDDLIEAMRANPVRKGEGLQGRMAITGEPVEIPDIADAAAYQSRVRDPLIRLGYRSLLAVPLLRENHLLGGLAVNRKKAGAFDPQVVELLKTFATQSALAIQNARLYREIEVKSRELEAASRHKSEFLANMSHELRTPLNAIIGFSEVLSERMFGEINEKQAEYLSDILESGRHLLSLINDILDLSKIEAGRVELEVSDFHLPSEIDNTLILVRERAQRRGVALGRDIDESLAMIRADQRKVKQVLLNLLSNALKFTPEGGRIDVRASVRDGMAEISVTDTGVGIEPKDQEVVFEEFRQVGSVSKKVEGTGLGLAISRKFIELHGGKIWVTSKVGSGSTFTFTLPL